MEPEEIEILDALVEEHNLNHAICPNHSRHWKNVRLSSDFMFDHDFRFLINKLAKREFGYTFDKLRTHTYDDNRNIYYEYNLGTKFPLEKLIKENSGNIRNWYMAGRSDRYMDVLEYRWDNGFVFMNYSDRVTLALEQLVDNKIEGMEKEALRINQLIGVKESVAGEMQELSKKQKLSPQLAKVLEIMANDVSIGMIKKIEDSLEDDT